MGSLGALRRGSYATAILVFGFLTLLLLLVLVGVDLVLASRSFPGAFGIVFGLALLFILFQWWVSPLIVRWAIRDRTSVTPQSNQWLYATVQQLAGQAGVPMPRVWTVPDPAPNAFVFGHTLQSAELVVTRGLLENLNQDEIRAVLAHEVGHLRHRDVLIMTVVSAVPLLAYILARGGFEIIRHGRFQGKRGGQAAAIAVVVAVVSYTIYLVTQLLVLYLSRTREYYADAYSGAATRDPHLLASALTKITYGLSLARKPEEPTGLRAFMIGDPVKASGDHRMLRDRMARYDLDRDGQLDTYELQKAMAHERRTSWARANELFRTHPLTYRRILMLEQLEEEILRGRLPENIYTFV